MVLQQFCSVCETSWKSDGNVHVFYLGSEYDFSVLYGAVFFNISDCPANLIGEGELNMERKRARKCFSVN